MEEGEEALEEEGGGTGGGVWWSCGHVEGIWRSLCLVGGREEGRKRGRSKGRGREIELDYRL